MNPKDLQELKEQLEKTAGELEAQIKSEKKTPEYGSDVDSFDEEADEAEEQGKKYGVQQVLKERLENVEKALDKIIRGGYGKCEKCGKDIPSDVLKVNPESGLCKNCKV